ncbi:Bifunctional uridylyltransferase/uridylyl-removing enzyme [Brevundimonas sp. SH203]|uniref:[protein-PII] uridylyltransferase n=1 Tax=Brevundimonas sp. SH203 TaxID=345167 RepID=UPI0009C75528|nr:[protein-PII] uridylyltransferase [Brevundimonas sp. SH203]GAW42359.1 Bifunctional uridylyltransferase/uridylyl-removing enzyme [Brevundimonas sp. SH203]
MTPASPSLDDRLDEAAAAHDPRAAVSFVLREAYEAARTRAERKLDAGSKGREVARLYAAAADDMLTALWRVATETLFPVSPVESERLSLVAVGGYGRGVLAPFSDLDLLFLRPAKATPRGESVIEFVLYVLWDLGAKVGPSVRSVEECLSLSRTDMTVRTTLLEARPLAGDQRLAELMIGRFRDMVSKSDPRPFIAAKLEERAVRHEKAGSTRYKVEPNVKDGKGGLRDLNTLYWIARSLAPESRLGATVMDELFTPRERRTSDEAFDFLWRVRIHLHLIAGRAEEKLTFDMQPEVARRMGWRGRGDEPAVERFMRRYFLVARDVGALTRAMSAKLEARHQKTAQGLSRLMTPFRPARRKLDIDGFWIDQGRLSVEGPEVFAADPVKLLTLFVAADKQDLDLHPDAFSAVTRSLSLVTPRLRRDPAATRAFLDVLAHGQRPYRVLTIMNETGLLGRFLPEWGRIVGQTQFNMYHAYTVDEHTLQAIGVINDIARGKLKDDHPLATEIVQLISDMEALMLGMLLHDVGKGGERGQLEDGAIAARRACERLGVDPRRIELVVWLVRSHLTLSDYAQKRDLSDPATIRAFAELVGDPERLRMLLVLTVADIRAVGPGVWNGWKGQLMRTLYNQVAALFRGEDVAREDPLAAHPALVRRARETGAAAQASPTAPVQGLAVQTTEISIAAADRPGLFADLAQTMAALGADVTDARVATEDGVVLDVFRVQDGAGAPYGQAEPRRLKTLVEALEKAARGEGRIGQAPQPAGNARKAAFEVRPVVMVDHHASEAATVIEVSCADRPGLLADLSRVFNDEGLGIRSAHVASYGERAVDSFYVVDRKGRKLTSEQRIAELRTALEAVLDSRAPAPAGRKVRSARASARDVSELGRRARKPVSPGEQAR